MKQSLSMPTLAIEVEEVITSYTSPENGSNPLWNAGSPLLIRLKDKVFVSIPETGEGIPSMCNTRWQLWQRDDTGWSLQQSELEYREREPCPLAYRGEGRLVLSVNPSVDATVSKTEFMGEPTPTMQYCSPHLLEFDEADPKHPPYAWMPRWDGPAQLKDHSYRGLAVDPEKGALLIFNKDRAKLEYVWSFLDKTGRWSSQGRVSTPINSCYPVLCLRDRSAHAVTVGDIIEPFQEWLDFKREHQKHRFFFVFRRIFYTWTPDISREAFAPPLEVDSVEDTAGHIWNLDMWLDPSGRAHLLCRKQNIASTLMRDRFFPGKPIIVSLEYYLLEKGRVINQSTLIEAEDKAVNETPIWGRFHSSPDGNLYVVAGFMQNGSCWNRICCLNSDGKPSDFVTIPLQYPFCRFFTATERGGSSPSQVLDLHGEGKEKGILRYARVHLGK